VATGCLRERNGHFYVRVRVLIVDSKTGAARWKQTEKAAGTSRRKAEQLLRSLQIDVNDGRFVPTRMTVLELGRKWLAEHVEPNLKPGAAANYRGTFYTHVAPVLGPLRVDECGQQVIRALLGRKRADGLSAATVAKIRRHVHAMFAFAQDAGLVRVNPADAPRARGRKHGQRRARGTQLSPMQVKRFLDECSPRWRLFFTVALDTGLRRGELIGLRWGDVDLLERILYVRRSIGPYDDPEELPGSAAVELQTKTESSQRLVPILDGAQAALERLFTDAENTDDEAPVFGTIERKPGRDGDVRPIGRPLSPRMVTRVFRRYAERAGLPGSIRLHDLRHTAITNAIGQGEDILLVSAFAGHAKTSTTVDVYGHLMPDRVRAAARRMRSISCGSSPAAPCSPLPAEGVASPSASGVPGDTPAAPTPYREPDLPGAPADRLELALSDLQQLNREIHALGPARRALLTSREQQARVASVTIRLDPPAHPGLTYQLGVRRAA
jgi:integrase